MILGESFMKFWFSFTILVLLILIRYQHVSSLNVSPLPLITNAACPWFQGPLDPFHTFFQWSSFRQVKPSSIPLSYWIPCYNTLGMAVGTFCWYFMLLTGIYLMDDNFPCGNLCFRSDAVEKVELSVISEDPVVAAKSAEIPSYWDEVQLPKADPRNEKSELPEQADKPVQLMFSCPGDKPLLTKSCRPQEETVELVNEHQGMKRLEREGSDFPKEGSRQCRLPPFEDEPIRRSSPYR